MDGTWESLLRFAPLYLYFVWRMLQPRRLTVAGLRLALLSWAAVIPPGLLLWWASQPFLMNPEVDLEPLQYLFWDLPCLLLALLLPGWLLAKLGPEGLRGRFRLLLVAELFWVAVLQLPLAITWLTPAWIRDYPGMLQSW